MIRDRRFIAGVIVVVLVALAIRLAYIWFERRGLPVGGDSRYYHEGANLLAKGKGYINPALYLDTGKAVESADHPPLYLTYLAVFSLVGLKTTFAHMVASAIAGGATVVVIAVLGRELGGARLGLIAGALAAVYPNLWVYDGSLESETVAQLAVAVTVLIAYLWWREPTRRHALLLGVAIAFAALARAEAIFLVLLVALPLVLYRSGLVRRERVRQLLAIGVATAVVIAPWCAYNLLRFERPTLLSTGFGATLDSAACDETWYGPFTGYWSHQCVLDAVGRAGMSAETERSQLEKMHRDAAIGYIEDHLSRWPVVMLARVGRVTGLYQLDQQMLLDNYVAGQEKWAVRAMWWSFFAAAILAIAGAVILRRQRIPAFPLVAPAALVVVTVAVFFGLVRYRAIAEVSLVVLAAVAVDAAIDRVVLRSRAG